jgi:ABC-type transporter Mla subunit MlaD
MALGASRFLRRTITVETYIEESVHGLEVGSPVKFRGVKIGEVNEIGFANRFYDTRLAYVLVRCAARPEAFRDPNDPQKLHEQLVDMIQRGLRVRLAAAGLTGTAYLEADYLDAARFPPLPIDWTPELPYVPSAPSVVVRVTNTLEAVLEGLRATDISGTVEAARAALVSFKDAVTAANVGGVSEEARELLRSTRGAIDETRGKLDGMLKRANDAVGHAETLLADLAERVRATRWQDAIDTVAAAAGEARDAVKELRRVLGNMDGALLRIDALVADQRGNVHDLLATVQEAALHLRGLAATLERYPSLLFFGEAPLPARKDK